MTKDILILHRSLVVQKGLYSLLFSRRKGIIKSHTDYKHLEFLGSLSNTYLFVDTALDKTLTEYKNILTSGGNTVTGISFETNSSLDFPYNENILITDSEILLNSKFEKVFKSERNPEEDSNRSSLTLRELEILKLVAKGNSSKDIAKQLYISLHTVITHRKNICRKLGIKTPSGLTLYAMLNNII